MIVDQLTNAHLYTGLGPRIARAMDYLRQTDLRALDVGARELDGRTIYVVAQRYSTKPPDQGKWEAHRRYIDLQYVVEGVERIWYAPIGRMAQGEYDETKDYLPLSGTGDCVTLRSGDFMLLWPGEGHMPGTAVDTPAPVTKVVVKIALE